MSRQCSGTAAGISHIKGYCRYGECKSTANLSHRNTKFERERTSSIINRFEIRMV